MPAWKAARPVRSHASATSPVRPTNKEMARSPMPAKDVSEPVRRLITEAIDSIAELEAILLLRSNASRDWDAEEAGARLYVSATVAAHILVTLAGRGFFQAEGGRYRYAPRPSEIEATVAALAAAYSSNLIAVTHLVHSKLAPSVRHFADAFWLRKDK